jgi:hypothetical protein
VIVYERSHTLFCAQPVIALPLAQTHLPSLHQTHAAASSHAPEQSTCVVMCTLQ